MILRNSNLLAHGLACFVFIQIRTNFTSGVRPANFVGAREITIPGLCTKRA
jgi:hypothetical protein